MTFMPFMWALLELGFGCLGVIFGVVLPLVWLTESHTTHQVFYAVLQVLPAQNKTTHETKPTPTKITPNHNHTINNK